jgi:hypothetical protein
MSGTNIKPEHGVSSRLAVWLQPFSDCFTLSTWRHVLVLVAGAILSPGRRTALPLSASWGRCSIC